MRVQSIALALMIGVGAAWTSEAAAQTTARTLDLKFNADGTVTLAMQNVTPREVLAEWARRCGCYVINSEKMTGAPIAIPVRFENASQAVVLESLLRQAAGFALTPRRAGATGPSEFETIYVLATSSPSASAYSPAYSPVAPVVNSPGSPADEIPPVVPQPLNLPRADSPQGQQQPPQGQGPLNRPGPPSPGVFVPMQPIGPAAPAPGTPTKGGGTTPPLGGLPVRGGGGR